MTKKIFHYWLNADLDDGETWEEYKGFLVVAESKEEAKQFIIEQANGEDELKDGTLESYNDIKVYDSIEDIPKGVLMTHFHYG